jgi:hypothetical protein
MVYRRRRVDLPGFCRVSGRSYRHHRRLSRFERKLLFAGPRPTRVACTAAKPLAKTHVCGSGRHQQLTEYNRGGADDSRLHHYLIAVTRVAAIRGQHDDPDTGPVPAPPHQSGALRFFLRTRALFAGDPGTVDEPFNPIFGATLAFLLTVVALYLLIILLYTTINQMRPVQVLEAIHDHVLAARERQLVLVRKTRRKPSGDGSVTVPVKAAEEGFVTRIDVDAIGLAALSLSSQVEIILVVSVGSYVVFQDVIANVTAHPDHDVAELIEITREAVLLERLRDITADAGYGVEQLAMIGWTSISSAKSNLGPGLLALHALRDIMAHWSVEKSTVEKQDERGLYVLADRL